MEKVNYILETIDIITQHRVDSVYRYELASMLEHVECMIDNDDIDYGMIELYIERLELIKQRSALCGLM